MEGDKIDHVTVFHRETGDWHEIKAVYYLDGTDTGEMLPLAKMEYVTGAESQAQTWELHALNEADPLDMQAVTHCFAVDYNVPQTNYFLGPVIETADAEAHLQAAKELSLSFLYWLQTEAVTEEGKIGYKGLRLRKDVVGTSDGLAKAVYIRESRRIRAEFTILEEHVGKEARKSEKAEAFWDSVGIGSYRIDLHPSTGNRNYLDIDCLPFRIPLGSMIPVRMDNMLPACKNIGTTHITNGCYRLHPVEWGIGEVAGYLAAFCIKHNYIPREVRNTKEKLYDFQRLLVDAGIELSWD